MMSNIKVPFLPISDFDPSNIIEDFRETYQEEIFENINKNDLIKSMEASDEGGKTFDNIALILIGMGMEKYVKLFQEEGMSFGTFLQLNEPDLHELGITDPEDRKAILMNLSIFKKNTKEIVIPENHNEDLRIIENVSCHLKLLQKYSAFVNIQMKKHKLTDYAIDEEETACTYLKSFTESALIQSQILSQAVYDEQNAEALLNKIHKECNIPLPKEYYRAFKKKKTKRKLILKILTVVGLTSIFVLTGKYFIRKWHVL